jgi:hypothetical protein
MSEEEETIRVYCPEHNAGFKAEKKPEIFCRQGNHFLSLPIPPEKDFLAYCCICQRYYPFYFHESGSDKVNNCISCTRKIFKRYLCFACRTIVFDSDRNSINKGYFINDENGIIPNCPGCQKSLDEGKTVDLHDCQILATGFFTVRTKCPFCGEQIGDSKLSRAELTANNDKERAYQENESSETEILVAPEIANKEIKGRPVRQKEDNKTDENQPQTETRKKNDETASQKNHPEPEPEEKEKEISNDGKNPVKLSSGTTGCLVVLIFLGLCSFCFFINKVNNGSDNGNQITGSNNSSNINNSANVSPNSTNRPSATPAVSLTSATFRGNARVQQEGAPLKIAPEEYSENLTSLSADTLVRVVDRKGLSSRWYKVKTEDGDEGWIDGNFISEPDWNSLSCKDGEIGYISGGNLRSSPKHSVNEENIEAIWNRGAKVEIIGITKGEPGAKTLNPYWYKIKILQGECSFDTRNAYSKDGNCESRVEGYMSSSLIDCD